MSFLCLVIRPQLCLSLLSERPDSSMIVDGTIFTKKITDDIVFYDWIVDSTALIQALEIHLAPLDPFLTTHTPLAELPYIDTACFVRIWIRQAREGVGLGKEAFGDLFFFGSECGELAIVVGLQDWLSSSERHDLLSSLSL